MMQAHLSWDFDPEHCKSQARSGALFLEIQKLRSHGGSSCNCSTLGSFSSVSVSVQCVCSVRHHFSCLLHQSPVRAVIMPPFQAGTANLALGGNQIPFSKSSLHFRACKTEFAPSTIKVYVAAIPTSHSPLDGTLVGRSFRPFQ